MRRAISTLAWASPRSRREIWWSLCARTARPLQIPIGAAISDVQFVEKRKEGCVSRYDHHRQRGPVNALQMRLQG